MGAINAEREQGGEGLARFAWACPLTGELCCGGNGIVIGHPAKPSGAPTWSWDGNVEQPTLNPSINCNGGCGWHGYMRAGAFKLPNEP